MESHSKCRQILCFIYMKQNFDNDPYKESVASIIGLYKDYGTVL